MSLLSCPSDVLLIILEHLVPYQDPECHTSQLPSADRRLLASQYGFQFEGEATGYSQARYTFSSLALTCKHISEAAMMMLYREICLWDGPAMIYLLRTLLTSPRLRHHVRSLACSQHLDNSAHEKESRMALEDSKLDLNSMLPFERSVFGLAKCEAYFSGTLPRPEDILPPEFEESLEDPKAPFFVPVVGASALASLLCLVPNITRFCFAPPRMDEDYEYNGAHVYEILRDSLARAADISTPDGEQVSILPRLSTLALYTHSPTRSDKWDCIWIPFWARFSKTGIRRLETLQAFMIFDPDNEDLEQILDRHRFISETNWGALEEMQALLTGTEGPDWSQVVELFPKLKEAHISFTREFWPQWSSPPRTLNNALPQLKETLESLRIGGIYIESQRMEIGPEQRLSCLHQFNHLRHLDIATFALFGSLERIGTFSIGESLPASLDTIFIREMWSEDDLDSLQMDLGIGTIQQQESYSGVILVFLIAIIDASKSLPRLRSLCFQEELPTWRVKVAKFLPLLTEGRVPFSTFHQDGQPMDLGILSSGAEVKPRSSRGDVHSFILLKRLDGDDLD